MKKAIVYLAIATGAICAPALGFAQSNAPLTRADVRADLVQFEQAGYNTSAVGDASYPAGILAAEAKVAAQSASQGSPAVEDTSAYGGVVSGSTSSSRPARTATKSSCVGPVSFCTLYFGS